MSAKKYIPKSLLEICAASLWSHSNIHSKNRPSREFQCLFCYKALLSLQREKETLSKKVLGGPFYLSQYPNCNPNYKI